MAYILQYYMRDGRLLQIKMYSFLKLLTEDTQLHTAQIIFTVHAVH